MINSVDFIEDSIYKWRIKEKEKFRLKGVQPNVCDKICSDMFFYFKILVRFVQISSISLGF